MPNWCTTTYHFYGQPDEIKRFNRFLRDAVKDDLSDVTLPNGLTVPKNDFGKTWLGNCLYLAGIDPDEEKLRCRGWLCEFDVLLPGDDCFDFNLYTETSWVPMTEMWTVILEKLGFGTIRFSYLAHEPEIGMYFIYDPDHKGYFEGDEVRIDIYQSEENKKIPDDISRMLSRVREIGLGNESVQFISKGDFFYIVSDIFPDIVSEYKEDLEGIADYLSYKCKDLTIRVANYVEDWDV